MKSLQQEYLEYMGIPLSITERAILTNRGWQFIHDSYMLIPDDYDGCMAYGISSIRKILFSYLDSNIYFKHKGNGIKVFEELKDLKMLEHLD